MPGPLRNRVSSVHTHGGCALLCDRPRCHGRCEIVDYPIRPNAAITGTFQLKLMTSFSFFFFLNDLSSIIIFITLFPDHFDLSKSNFNDVVASIRQC